jgi:ATP-binding cassette subfamily C protein
MEQPAAILEDESGDASTWVCTRRLLTYAMQVDGPGFWLALLVSFGASIAEGVGLLLLLPLLSITGMNFGTGSPAGRLGNIVQALLMRIGLAHTLWLPAVLGIFLAVVGMRSVLRRSQSMMSFATTMKVELALSRRVYSAVVRAQWGFLVRQRAGRMTHVLAAELRRVAEAMGLLLSLVNLCCLTLLYFAIALKLSVAMTLIVLAIGAGITLLQRKTLERVRTASEDLNESIGEVFAATQDHLLNMKSVKTYNAEERDLQLYAGLCSRVAQHAVANARQQAASAFVFEIGSLAALGGVIFLALGVLHVQAAAMLLLLAVFTRLMPQLAAMQNDVHQLASVLPSFGHVLAVEADCLRHHEPPAVEDNRATELRNELRMEGVWFAYQADDITGADQYPEENYVLRDVDITIRAGQITALTGASGAGKSTVADLANGLLLPVRGSLIVDGHRLEPGTLRNWRNSVGYVGQDAALFHESVRENLMWAKPDATENDMREALTLASADFVFALPNGLESVVGQRGILLSSGQRQRISLARALLRKPALLILDEATNALDIENEDRVLQALHHEVQRSCHDGAAKFTVLMIAHRPEAIRRADFVLELEDGRIRRTGAAIEMGFEAR